MHFDNDKAGRLATKALEYSLSDSYKIIDAPAESGKKDYNDFFMYYKKI
ncbi:MAG: toprim domain-containing protein [Clostridium sp.]|nr:MAG: toprim domain-containing protein [Clostridium sp.]